jgi:hypothetical protein
MKVLSIDVGLYHMGLVVATLNDDMTVEKIHDCDLVDITTGCGLVGCQLEHGRNICDYMSHFFQNYNEVLEETDIILIEQQPPMGFVAIQELVRFNYRSKTKVISPRTVHCHFGIQHLDYERRKLASEDIARHWLSEFKNYTFQERKHDMADAYCQLKWWSSNMNKQWIDKSLREKANCDFSTIISHMESLAFDINEMSYPNMELLSSAPL